MEGQRGLALFDWREVNLNPGRLRLNPGRDQGIGKQTFSVAGW